MYLGEGPDYAEELRRDVERVVGETNQVTDGFGNTRRNPWVAECLAHLVDYEVFLLSRIREEYLRTGDTSGSVARWLAKTARVITAARRSVIVVFLAFVFSSEVFLKHMGLAMATVILVDATIVRVVLAPAAMQLLAGRTGGSRAGSIGPFPGWTETLCTRRLQPNGPETHLARVPGSSLAADRRETSPTDAAGACERRAETSLPRTGWRARRTNGSPNERTNGSPMYTRARECPTSIGAAR
jgi:MMPL family